MFFPKSGDLNCAWLPNKLLANFGRLKHGTPTTTTYINGTKNRDSLVAVEV